MKVFHKKYFSVISKSQFHQITNTNKSSSSLPESLKFYRDLLQKNEKSYSFIFPEKINSTNDFKNYLNLPQISKNISINSDLQINSINESIFFPCNDLIKRGGKKWRPMFGLIISNYLNQDISCFSPNGIMIYKLLHLTELLHNASLIIDDVEDKSKVRRGDKCVHLKYGEDIAINAGISMFYFPIRNICATIDDDVLGMRIMRAYLEEMSAIHIGQGWDIEMKIDRRVPNVENYRDTVLFKTGVFPRLIIKFIEAVSSGSVSKSSKGKFNVVVELLKDLADSMSVGFQIKDDLLNITESELAKNKGAIGEDITEGKLTLMVIHALNGKNRDDGGEIMNKDAGRLKEILMMKTEDHRLIMEAIEIMDRNKSLKYAEDIMIGEINKCMEICQTLRRFGEFNTDAIDDLEELVNYLINRSI